MLGHCLLLLLSFMMQSGFQCVSACVRCIVFTFIGGVLLTDRRGFAHYSVGCFDCVVQIMSVLELALHEFSLHCFDCACIDIVICVVEI